MSIRRLSIIVPVFNEAVALETLMTRLDALELRNSVEKELIFVDDASSDRSRAILEGFDRSGKYPFMTLHVHPENTGKGGAVHTGLQFATGDHVVIQDADLELYPEDINVLLGPVLEQDMDVVFGSRFLAPGKVKVPFLQRFANLFLTRVSNWMLGMRLTDMNTCYKMIRTNLFRELPLQEKGFGFEPEVIARLSRYKNLRFIEVPVRYEPRTREEGKKIGWRDGVHMLACIFRYGPFGK